MKLHYGAQTDVGKTRDHNEDNFGVAEHTRTEQFGHLFIVCDGVGGSLAGEIASKLAVDTVLESYYTLAEQQHDQALIAAIELANQAVLKEGRGTGMGTTCVAALLYAGSAFIANIGDSRAYLFRDGRPRQISNDHSFVAEQVRAGLMTPEQARVSHVKNIITRAIGQQPQIKVDLFREPMQPGDILLLCSDGLHGLVEDEELARIALQQEPQKAVEELIALANARGGNDNITAIIVKVEETGAVLSPEEDELLASLLSSGAASAQTATTPLETTQGAARQGDTERLEAVRADNAGPAAAVAQPGGRRLSKSGLLISLLLLVVLLGGSLFLVGPRLLGLSSMPGTGLATATPSPTVVPTATPAPTNSPEDERPANQSGEATPASPEAETPQSSNPTVDTTVTPSP